MLRVLLLVACAVLGDALPMSYRHRAVKETLDEKLARTDSTLDPRASPTPPAPPHTPPCPGHASASRDVREVRVFKPISQNKCFYIVVWGAQARRVSHRDRALTCPSEAPT